MNEEISRIDINNVSYNLKDEETRTLSEMGKQALIKIGYYECSSEASSASKTIAAPNYVLGNGGSIKVKMTNANSAANATLNINSTGTKPLYYDGERASANNSWETGETVEIYYDGTSYYANNVAGSIGYGDGVFDVSVKYPTIGVDGGNTYTLAGALAVLNTNLSSNKKRGGMSIKFVHTSDNKYVQYRLMANSFTTDVTQWQGVDDLPTVDSDNFVKSGGVEARALSIEEELGEHFNIADYHTFVSGFIVQNTGALNGSGVDYDHAPANGWLASPFISVKEGKVYAIIAGSGKFFNDSQAALYDSEKTFIENSQSKSLHVLYGGEKNGWYYFKIPTGAAFLRISTNGKANAEIGMLIEVDSEYDLNYLNASNYIPYSTIFVKGTKENTEFHKFITKVASNIIAKKIIVIGDSMVYGNYVGTNNVWVAKIAETLKMNYEVNPLGQSSLTENVIINAGINSVMLSNNNAPFASNIDNAVINRYFGMDNDADYVIVFAGNNDAWALYRNEIQLGAIDSVDDTTFNGALNVLMQGLLTKYPTGKIAFITPYTAPSSDDGAASREAIINAIKAACIRNGGIPCFDNSVIGGIDWNNPSQKTALTKGDNIHLNAAGHAWVMSKYKTFIESL